MMRPAPLPPLFPYTTLFRSAADAGHGGRAVGFHDLAGDADGIRIVLFGNHRLERTLRQSAVTDFAPAWPADAADRKSTRLNSSHRCISYAVFCLKKKNETHH